MHDSHDEEAVDMGAYLKRAQKDADKGEYWYLWLLGLGLSAFAFWFVLGFKGLGFWVIGVVVVLLLLLVEIRSSLYAMIVLGLGALAAFAYLIIFYQTP